MDALAFQAVLVPYAPSVDWPAKPVVRTIAVREDQTLETAPRSSADRLREQPPLVFALGRLGGELVVGDAQPRDSAGQSTDGAYGTSTA